MLRRPRLAIGAVLVTMISGLLIFEAAQSSLRAPLTPRAAGAAAVARLAEADVKPTPHRLTFIALGASNMLYLAPFFPAAFPGREVVVIPCTVGSTAISQWLPGGDLYPWCMGMARDAGTPIDGLFVYQGESDSLAMPLAQEWAGKFTALVAAMRGELGNIPVVYAQLGRFEEPGWSTLKDAQAHLNLPKAAMVRTDDLVQVKDSMHFPDPNYVVIAQRFAAAWSRLAP